jgi:hypothetical protein
MNTEKFAPTERGQALIIMIFGMIALLVVAGLAIDGGTIYMERRHAQNAADAAALAGTRALAQAICSVDGADDATVLAQVLQLAESNDIYDPANNVSADYVDNEATVLGPVGSGTIPTGATGVSTVVDVERKTFFLSLVGIDTSAASAHALGMTGPPLVAGGMRPFGVPEQIVTQLDPDDVNLNWFTINFKNDGMTWATGQMQHRGWMNLGYVWNAGEDPGFPRAIDEGAGASTIRDWMINGWTGTIYTDAYWSNGARDGDFIHAKPGTNSTAVCAAPQNMAFPIPIYDVVPDCPTEIPTAKPTCPHQGSSYAYHIVGIATVEVTDCNQGGGEITLVLKRMVLGEGIPNLSEGLGYNEGHACDSHTQVVTLWE